MIGTDDNPERAVAEWMFARLAKVGELYQEDVVHEIKRKFGSQFVYENENGNPAISRGVLKAFRNLTGKDVVWERGERLWRKRQNHDTPERMQE